MILKTKHGILDFKYLIVFGLSILTLYGCAGTNSTPAIRIFEPPVLIEADPNKCNQYRNAIFDGKIIIDGLIYYTRKPVQNYIGCTIIEMKAMNENLKLWELGLDEVNAEIEDSIE